MNRQESTWDRPLRVRVADTATHWSDRLADLRAIDLAVLAVGYPLAVWLGWRIVRRWRRRYGWGRPE